MPRFAVPTSVAVLLLVGLALAGSPAFGTVAQGGTPAAGEEFAPEGVRFEPIGFGVAEELPAAPADLVLIRFTIEPGAGFPLDAEDRSVVLVTVESGALAVEADVPLRVTRAAAIAAFATPGAVEEGAVPAPEEAAGGTGFTLEAGDSVVFPPRVAGEVRNEGREPVVALAAIVEPLDGGATPAAGATPAGGVVPAE